MTPVRALSGNIPLYCLALGAFAIGTEGFMISGLLPVIARDLDTTVATTGQLVTAFALAYAISSPLLTTLTARLPRRQLLRLALTAFAAANLFAAVAPGFWWLMAARVLLAMSAGLYMPNANALAGSVVHIDRRGRALATVHAGITIAVAVGVPLGAMVGNHLGWRATFLGVGALAALVLIGLSVGLPRTIGSDLPVASFAQRKALVRQPMVLWTLATTTLWTTGSWSIYPYLAPYLAQGAGIDGAEVSGVYLLYGVSAALGVFISGRMIDRLGSGAVLTTSLLIMASAYVGLSLCVALLPPDQARLPMLCAIAAWGIAGFAFNPAQQAKLIGVVGVHGAPVALSLNGSFIYIGFSLGAVLGSLTISLASIRDIGWTGATCELCALALLQLTVRGRPR